MNNEQNTEIQSATDTQGLLEALVMCGCYPEHCTHGGTCWCEPTIEIVNGSKIIAHNEGH